MNHPDHQELIILGTGGNCLDILDAVQAGHARGEGRRYRVLGFLDDDTQVQGRQVAGLPVLGSLADAARYPSACFVNGIGSPQSYLRKPEILGRTGVPLERFATIIDPSASVSPSATLGPGTVVLQSATVNARARVGAQVIVLPNSVISHDAVIGDYGCIASSACIAGGVVVEESCYLGANCSIKTGVRIGRQSLVGMGAVVLEDVPDRTVVVGNPARVLRSSC
jgi:sugar O-acyltransferase (sialic acid O-acetyltransferase NeuD family)